MAEKSETRTTTDHDEMRAWLEENGDRPANVPGGSTSFTLVGR